MKRVGYITDKDGRRITLLEAMGELIEEVKTRK